MEYISSFQPQNTSNQLIILIYVYEKGKMHMVIFARDLKKKMMRGPCLRKMLYLVSSNSQLKPFLKFKFPENSSKGICKSKPQHKLCFVNHLFDFK